MAIVPIHFRRSAEVNFTDTRLFCEEYVKAPLQARREVAEHIPLDVIRDIWYAELRHKHMLGTESVSSLIDVLLAAASTRVYATNLPPFLGYSSQYAKIFPIYRWWTNSSTDDRALALPLMSSWWLQFSSVHPAMAEYPDYLGMYYSELWNRQMSQTIIMRLQSGAAIGECAASFPDIIEWSHGDLVKKLAFVILHDRGAEARNISGIPEYKYLKKLVYFISFSRDSERVVLSRTRELLRWFRELPNTRDANALRFLFSTKFSGDACPARVRKWAYLPIAPYSGLADALRSHRFMHDINILVTRDANMEYTVATRYPECKKAYVANVSI